MKTSVADSEMYFSLVPPLLALTYLALNPFLDKLHSVRLEEYFECKKLPELPPIVDGIAKDYGLKMNWLATLMSVIASILTLARARSQTMMAGVIIFLLVAAIPITIDIFSRTPGYHSTTKVGRLIFLRPLQRFDLSRLTIYSIVLALLNLSLIVLIVWNFQPQKATILGPGADRAPGHDRQVG